jgi:hypothetical protein
MNNKTYLKFWILACQNLTICITFSVEIALIRQIFHVAAIKYLTNMGEEPLREKMESRTNIKHVSEYLHAQIWPIA